MYTYFGTVVAVHDGDTITLDVDLGFGMWFRGQHFRLAAVSARELSQPGGVEARNNLRALIPPGTRVAIGSIKVDGDPEAVMSFDRYVVTVTLPDGRDLATLLVTTGWASWWNGKTRPIPYPAWPI